MKLAPVALVAVVTSLATVGTIELLRGERPESPPAPMRHPAAARAVTRGPGEAGLVAPPPDEAEPVQPVDASDWAAYGSRLDELERRLGALELDSASARVPVPSGTEELPEPELRELVLDWVAEERESQAREKALEAAEEERNQLEFDARAQALELAQRHGLAQWQEDEFAALFLEMGIRAREIERGVDLSRDNPEDVEARWIEFDEWIDARERELTMRLDPQLYEAIYGDDE